MALNLEALFPRSPVPAAKETGEASFDSAILDGVPAASYALDKNHAFLSVSVDHSMGLSDYTIVFDDYDATVTLDPDDLSQSSVSVSINPAEIYVTYKSDYKATHHDSAYETWEQDISMNPNWLNAGAFPEITFASTSVTQTGDNTGKVTGDLSFLGVTKPVTLDVMFRGSGDNRWGPGKILGFDASASFLRSDFGNSTYAPAIGDEIELSFSAEFKQVVDQ